MVLSSLNFCLSEKLLLFPSILNEILARYCNLGCRFFPFSYFKYPAIPFWPAEFLLKDQLLNIWGFPCALFVAFSILSLWLVFVSLISMCLGIFLLRFILCGTLCASWTWLFPFPCWEIFNYNLFKKFLILSFSLLLLLLLLLSHFSHVQLCVTP